MAKAKKKVWILDGGSLVIDRSQVLWHIDVGTPVRFPVYSVLIDRRRRPHPALRHTRR